MMHELLTAARLILSTAGGWMLYAALAGVVFCVLLWWWDMTGRWVAKWEEDENKENEE